MCIGTVHEKSYFTARPVYSNVYVDNFLKMILIYRYRITRIFKKKFFTKYNNTFCTCAIDFQTCYSLLQKKSSKMFLLVSIKLRVTFLFS